MSNKVVDFVKEARTELKKVNWPSKQQTVNYTIIVVAMSLVVAAFLGALDYFFGGVLRNFIK